MKKYFLCVVLFALSSGMVSAQSFVDTQTPSGVLPVNDFIGTDWALDFSDEFNGSVIDDMKWEKDDSKNSRGSKLGIGIKEWYFKPENLELRDGKLVIKVTKPEEGVMHCAGIHGYKSGGGAKYNFQYGYVEARIKIADSSKGTHTALWMSGAGQKNVDGTCNDGAEIDIVESSELTDHSHLTLYWDGYGTPEARIAGKQYEAPGIHDGEFHTFGLLWTENVLRVYYDGKPTMFGKTYVEFTELIHMVRAAEYLWLSCGASNQNVPGITFKDEPLGLLTEAEIDYVRVWKKKPNENLVKNGDFLENGYAEGTTVWKGPGMIPGGIVFDMDDKAINPPSARFSGVGLERYIYQDIEVLPGRKYKLSFVGRTHNSHGPSGTSNSKNSKLMADVYAGNSTVKLFSTSTTSNVNTLIEGEFVVPSDVSFVRLQFTKDIGIAYLDDVTLIQEKKIVYPALRMDRVTNCVYMEKVSPYTSVCVVAPDGTEHDFGDGHTEIAFDFTGKSLGTYTFKLTGEQEKTFVIHTDRMLK